MTIRNLRDGKEYWAPLGVDALLKTLQHAQHPPGAVAVAGTSKLVLSFWQISMLFVAPFVSSLCSCLEFAAQTTRNIISFLIFCFVTFCLRYEVLGGNQNPDQGNINVIDDSVNTINTYPPQPPTLPPPQYPTVPSVSDLPPPDLGPTFQPAHTVPHNTVPGSEASKI